MQATTDRNAITEAEAARYLCLSRSHLRRLRVGSRGEGPAHIRIGRRCVRYLVSDLDAWLASRRVTAA